LTAVSRFREQQTGLLRFNYVRMNRFGRVNIILVVGIAVVLMLGYVIFMTRESVQTVGTKFMSALAKGDVNTLTELSALDGRDKEDLRKQWDFAINKAGKHYLFRWRIMGSKEADENSAAVRMQVIRNAMSSASYEENFQLPMVKEDGRWKVDVGNISRDMFPALPR